MGTATSASVHDVFISYAREDKARVKQLVHALTASRGWSIWWDAALRPGAQFPREIEATLASARCVLVVWSRHSIASDWVVAEASEGWQRGILVALRLDESQPPLPFRQTHAADLSNWRGSRSAPELLGLVDSIDRVLQQQPAPAPGELEERESRRRAHERRRLIRGVGAAAALLVLPLSAWLLYQNLAERQSAERLAAQADAVRAQVVALSPEEKKRLWFHNLLEDRERLDRLDLATLLATEAFKSTRTERTERALRDVLAISPFSDKHVIVDEQITTLRFSHDGRLIVAGGARSGVLVWDLETNKLKTPIPHGSNGGKDWWTDARGKQVHRGPFVVDVSPSGQLVATAGPDESAALWDAQSGRELKRLAHASTVTAVAFGPQGEILATATDKGSVHLWDVASGKALRKIEQGGASYWVGISPAGTYLASSTIEHGARVWERSSGREIAHLQSEGPHALAARFSADERLIATFGYSHRAVVPTTVWDIETAAVVWRTPIASNESAGVVFAPDGRTLIVGGTDGSLKWWDLERGRELYSFSLGGFIIAMATSADRRVLAIADGGEEIARVWDARTARELRQMPYGGWLTAVAVSPDGRYLASSGRVQGLETAIELTEIWPEDPVAAACRRARRNLTHDEWQKYVGALQSYRATCPEVRTDGQK